MHMRLATTQSNICAFSHPFTGKERDTESGLDYFGARYYGSNMGRFMSPDWSSEPDPVPYADLSNPQSLNMYAYVRNNPLRTVDPDGHDGEDEDEAEDPQQAGTIAVPAPIVVAAPSAAEILGGIISASPFVIGGGLVFGPAMLYPKDLDCGCLPVDAHGNPITTTTTATPTSSTMMREHTKRKGSKKKTNDKHTKPRPGRQNTKDRQNPNWRPYRDYVKPKSIVPFPMPDPPSPPTPPPPPKDKHGDGA
jgi:RHS repeat-associated protein